MKHSLDRHTCGTYTKSTVVDGLSELCKAVSLTNKWRLSQVLLFQRCNTAGTVTISKKSR